ncbi:Protein YcgL [Thalassocella blandensis]|nr:Protein YcgL [Thalassocella blandensis]
MQLITQIYRSTKKEGAYLYTILGSNVNELPEALLKQLGKLEPAMVLKLNEDRKLAQADVKKVIHSLQENGYYLQLPPLQEASYMQQIENSKLTSRTL